MPASPSTGPSPLASGLGYLALVPFVATAVLAWTGDATTRPSIAGALSAYAAVVASFIGALHWGLAFGQATPAKRLFAWGVMPSIVAWIAVLSPPRIGLPVEAALLVACYAVDRATYPREGVGAWLPLRLRLTIGAVASCLVGAAAVLR